MRPIPQKLRKEMSDDPYYEQCVLTNHGCVGRIEWHHAVIFGGRQLNEKWAIVPLCQWHHKNVENKEIKAKVMHIVVNRATDDEIKRVSKVVNYSMLYNRI